MNENAKLLSEEQKVLKSERQEWTESIIIALVLAIFIRTFFIQAFKIPSGSMRPTLIERDRLMVSKLRYGPLIPFTKIRIPGLGHPKRGDVVVFVYPQDPKKDFIKRIVGMPGDEIEIKGGDIYVDGERIEEPVIKNTDYFTRSKSQYGKAGQVVKVPEGMYYVLGDNSASSHDSRYWGFVPAESIVGKAEFIYWPFTRVRAIK